MTSTDTHHTPPITDCPPWCQLPPGHGWYYDPPVCRDHRLRIGTVALSDADAALEVAIEWCEPAPGADMDDPGPKIMFDFAVDGHLTAGEARRLAAVLTEAADRLAKIS